ncbi:hypothetical protein ACFQL7_26060 [Halocatena marina]|uniref:Uncharacterized protein n=1 Tax=Halocatena marina TaxID=2934937 RepID=A0ABD5YYA5_9EURY
MQRQSRLAYTRPAGIEKRSCYVVEQPASVGVGEKLHLVEPLVGISVVCSVESGYSVGTGAECTVIRLQ